MGKLTPAAGKMGGIGSGLPPRLGRVVGGRGRFFLFSILPISQRRGTEAKKIGCVDFVRKSSRPFRFVAGSAFFVQVGRCLLKKSVFLCMGGELIGKVSRDGPGRFWKCHG